jgi:uncharacterized protein (TIGR00369 family)
MMTDVEKVEESLRQSPFDIWIGFHVIEVHSGSVVLEFHNEGETWCNPNHTVHGGVLYSMADSAMGAACSVLGKSTLTLELSMNYYLPTLPDSTIRAVAKVTHNGKSMMSGICDFYDEQRRYLAHGTGAYFVTGAVATSGEKGCVDHG